jgi:hypothetical protein
MPSRDITMILKAVVALAIALAVGTPAFSTNAFSLAGDVASLDAFAKDLPWSPVSVIQVLNPGEITWPT